MDPDSNQLDVIIKYTEPLILPEIYSFIPLYGNYGIITLPREELRNLSDIPGILYVEPSTQLYYNLSESRAASCISPATRPPYNLSGAGVIVGIIDSGIDIFHPDFQNEDGSTRIIALWDQTLPSDTNAPFGRGQWFDSQTINQSLLSSSTFPSRDLSGHGTHVAGIAAGNGRASGGRYQGVAPNADLLIVKLGSSFSENSTTVDFLLALHFCISTAVELRKPLALNISLGNNAGSHVGDSLVETYLDTIGQLGQTNIVVGTGNEGSRGKHKEVTIIQGSTSVVEFSVSPGEQAFPLSLWWNYSDIFSLALISPSGESMSLPFSQNPISLTFSNIQIYVTYFPPTPYRLLAQYQLDFVPSNSNRFVPEGIWKLSLTGERIVNGIVQLWLPAGSGTQPETQFLHPSINTTLTIPSTSKSVISVGAYNSRTNTIASFSGRGFTANSLPKPDLVAPGVDIISSAPGGGYVARTGTSMAAPFVTGSCALLMEYGILQNRDSDLYGQKLKATLLRGAVPFSDIEKSPNPTSGWGKLCLRNSLL